MSAAVRPHPSALGPFLGHVTDATARAWVRLLPGDGALHVEVTATPDGGPSDPPEMLPWLAGDSRIACGDVALPGRAGVLHRLAVEGVHPDGSRHLLGTLLVRPAEPHRQDGRIAFAFGSCWRVDAVLDPQWSWQALAKLARARHVDHLVLLGDQIYADLTPLPDALESATSAVRALGPGAPLAPRVEAYRKAYQRAWEGPFVADALARLPVAQVWDDHEISNGWGSLGWHSKDEGRAVFEAAALAHDEFQAARNPPALVPGLRAWSFRRGPAAFLGLDLRTARRLHEGVLLGEEQKCAVAAYLASRDALDARVLFVACSVPPLHLPRVFHAMRGLSDALDQWACDAIEADRRWLFARLLDYAADGARQVVLLGGDVHVATAVRAEAPATPIWQLTSSPMSGRLPAPVLWGLAMLGRGFTVKVDGRPAMRARVEHRWSGANIGVVTGDVTDGKLSLDFEVFRPNRRTVRLTIAE